jgi:hypothetical protein
LTAVVLVPAAALGTLLAARRPRNPLGWILLAIFFMAIAPADQYAALDYRMHHGMLPLGGLAVTVGAAWPSAQRAGDWRRGQLAHLAGRAGTQIPACDWRTPPAAQMALQRCRRPRYIGVCRCPGLRQYLRPGEPGEHLLTPIGFLAFAACFAVAVLRYRLYEIERIISRMISYAIITAMLAGVFAGFVLLATAVFPFKTPVAVAAATLAAAALFSPLRRRVQHAVDHRFNRARYNADQAVAAFAARLKDAVDPDSVRDLVGVVNRALEPVHVSVWLSHLD